MSSLLQQFRTAVDGLQTQVPQTVTYQPVTQVPQAVAYPPYVQTVASLPVSVPTVPEHDLLKKKWPLLVGLGLVVSVGVLLLFLFSRRKDKPKNQYGEMQDLMIGQPPLIRPVHNGNMTELPRRPPLQEPRQPPPQEFTRTNPLRGQENPQNFRGSENRPYKPQEPHFPTQQNPQGSSANRPGDTIQPMPVHNPPVSPNQIGAAIHPAPTQPIPTAPLSPLDVAINSVPPASTNPAADPNFTPL